MDDQAWGKESDLHPKRQLKSVKTGINFQAHFLPVASVSCLWWPVTRNECLDENPEDFPT